MTAPDLTPQAVADATEQAIRAIPPAWPLAATVAVNPYLGQTGETLAEAGARLARVAGVPVTMPRAWYQVRIVSGAITDADLEAARLASPHAGRPADLAELKAAVQHPEAVAAALATVTSLAAEISGVDWPGIIADRLGAFAADQFDEGQALWAASAGRGLYAAWRDVAVHDLTPEILGLKGFSRFVADAPEEAGAAIRRSAGRLGLAPAALEGCFHALLVSLGGWAHAARYRLWQAELKGGSDTTLRDFLAIRLLWEEALLAQYGEAIAGRWAEAAARHAEPLAPSPALVVDSILQEAAERAAQRDIAARLAAPAEAAPEAPVRLQAAFCIDVRSEPFRRALEQLDPGIRTLGFAGFFGLGASHRRFASDVAEHRLPVLLNAGFESRAGGEAEAAADQAQRFRARATRAWNRFKLAAVSSFAFVEASGPLYVGKLLRDSMGMTPESAAGDPAPRPVPPLPPEAQVDAAETVLRAMSLTGGFAPLVLLAGHGASVVNNPHASALHCGACGGYSGEVNARLLAALLNAHAVREGVKKRGIEIPAETRFVAALHDTTTDEVTLYDGDLGGDVDAGLVAQARGWLAAAGRIARSERALRFPGAVGGESLPARSRDWAQTRPEWALAGCQAFVAAPRPRTRGRSLEGRAFLHDYDAAADAAGGYKVLELILTAPVVVASWISLQYYGSAVSPQLFGGGNKLLHNVVGGIGVVEGNGGLLRTGLPWQSVHDGEKLVHDPLRLSVCIEAPREAISAILERHPGVRALFDNRWLHLFTLDAEGRMAWRYSGDLGWEPFEAGAGAKDAALLAA
jgi:uncharacterized protein YbcC (UPF0753/DUF2309 family)